MECLILGGGLAGLSLAMFLQDSPRIDCITILEKEEEYGGLCRSFAFDGRKMDIGPHIIFSRNPEVLNFMTELLGDNKEQHRRNNSIPHRGKWVHYPFENNLSALPEEDCRYCLETFLDNPYRGFHACNMLQFFLKIFGEGITNLYLRPYNEKIWKFDPAFMNTLMVDRIPRPPDSDIIRSAKGEMSEGHLHQLYFTYPKTGGIAALTHSIVAKFNDKVRIFTNREVHGIYKARGSWQVTAGEDEFSADLIVSCMPVRELVKCQESIASDVRKAAENLRHNDILIGLAKVRIDRMPDVHTLTIADKSIIFHRLSKPDYMGGEYRSGDMVTYMMEYTHSPHDKKAELPFHDLRNQFICGLQEIGLVKEPSEIVAFEMHKFPYAYVVYDLNHTKNMEVIRDYFRREGIFLHGRFGNFEYWNMDRIFSESRCLADKLKI